MTGFSILEVIIALALLMVVVVGALQLQFMADYWLLSSDSAKVALFRAEDIIGMARLNSAADFFATVSIPPVLWSESSDLPACAVGTRCYREQKKVFDISPCAKRIKTIVEWRVSSRYATSSLLLESIIFNESDVVKRGGDCLLESLSLGWSSSSPIATAIITSQPTFTTGLDVVGNRLYVVASSAPQFRIYLRPEKPEDVPELISSSVLTERLNAIDVVSDIPSGRMYAYAMQHTPTNQLIVLDVTDDNSVVVASKPLIGADPIGSFPQGWRVAAYGDRLYAFTRETAGAELHIFSLYDPADPVLLVGGTMNVNRTVNDFAVHEQMIDGELRRFLLLAASANEKEFAIIEVTNDTPIERVALNLPGNQDMLAVTILGQTIYVGRQQTNGGPELYQYNLLSLLGGDTTTIAQSEVGADVHTIRASESLLLLGVTRSGAEFQIWNTDPTLWHTSILNAARLSSHAAPRFAPTGMDNFGNTFYSITQSLTQPEQIYVWSAS